MRRINRVLPPICLQDPIAMVNHPIRRRILLLLMLLGNAGLVTAVSYLILSFINLNQPGSSGLLWRIVLLVSGLVLLWSLAASRWVDQHLSNLVSRAERREKEGDAA